MIVESKFLTVDDISTHYLEAGNGPPVLLLHSGEFGGCAELSWEHTIPALAAHFRVIAPDWLGFGQTDKLHDFVSGQSRRIRHMQRFVEAMEIGSAHFVGNSMGGTILAQAVAKKPDAFPARSLALLSSGGFTPDNEYRQRLTSYDCTREAMTAVVAAMFQDPAWAADEAYVERRYQLSLIPGAWECAAASRFKSPAVTARGEFGRPDDTPYEAISVPVLLVAGADDRLRLPGYAEEIAARIPDSEVHVLANCGHCPNIEQAQTTNRLLIEFLNRVQNRHG